MHPFIITYATMEGSFEKREKERDSWKNSLN
jgi:hypothetical protein